jgi:ribonuclease-3
LNRPDIGILAGRLGHEFRDRDLLESALTHRSAGRFHNERLEFLGDAVLGMCVAETVFRRLPEAEEGDLSRMRANLVNRDALARVARDLELGDFLRLGSGELKSGGFRRKSTLADGLEAVIGAVYLDAGLDAARAVIERVFGERLTDLPPLDALKDPKTRLQEYLQGRGLALPEYEVIRVTGQSHDQTFVVRCRIPVLEVVKEGEGSSRRRAEQSAAQSCLEAVHE